MKASRRLSNRASVVLIAVSSASVTGVSAFSSTWPGANSRTQQRVAFTGGNSRDGGCCGERSSTLKGGKSARNAAVFSKLFSTEFAKSSVKEGSEQQPISARYSCGSRQLTADSYEENDDDFPQQQERNAKPQGKRQQQPQQRPSSQPLSYSSVNNRHSSADWFYNVKSFPQSKVLRDVRHPVLAMAGWSLLVSILHKGLAASAAPWAQALAQNMCVSGAAHSFLVSALGLLLVFRTNSAYQRFYEGRKIWEHILSVSRNLSRIIGLYEQDIGSTRKQRLLHLIATYPYVLRHHIRPGCLCHSEKASDIPADHRLLLHDPAFHPVETRHEGDKQCGGTTRSQIDHEVVPSIISNSNGQTTSTRQCWVDKRKLPWSLLSNNQNSITNNNLVEQLAGAQNRPLWVCDRIGREIMNVPYTANWSSRERLTVIGQVEKLSNAIGECERIHQTAVPLNYARHSLRSLTVWLFTAPFALVKDLGLLTAPAVACMAWLLFGVYQIGYSIEDPFQGSLRLSILCDAIRQDVLGVAGQRHSAYASLEEESWDEEDPASAAAMPTSTHVPSSLPPPQASSPLPTLQEIQESTRQLGVLTDPSDLLLDHAPKLVKEKDGTWNLVQAKPF